MTPIERRLRQRIARDGPVPVAEYMALALGDAEHGYYRTRDPLGAAGDFVTAPEISQVFGELIGLWCAVTWRAMGAPEPVRLVELGPGRGTLMADALRAAAGVPEFAAAIDLHLVETGAALKRRQAEALAARAPGTLRCLVSVNIAGEVTKSGVQPDDVQARCKELHGVSGIEVVGLMCLPPFRDDPEDLAPWFEELADLARRGRDAGLPLHELSMGMSHDFPVAIRYGATWVRVGTAIFGSR